MAPSRDPLFQAKIDVHLAKMKNAAGDVSRATDRLRRLVGHARAAGVTWTEIGQCIGLTQQGAQKRYGSPGERADLLEARESARAARFAERRSEPPSSTSLG